MFDPLRLDPKALPCPFCGGVPVVGGEDSTWAMLCRVRCGECNANRMSYTKTRVEAIAAWNRRAPVVPVAPTREAVALVREAKQIAEASGEMRNMDVLLTAALNKMESAQSDGAEE